MRSSKSNNLGDVNAADKASIAEWLGCPSDDVVIEHRREPMSLYTTQAQEMLATYEDFPEDGARTDRILALLKSGAEKLPVYVGQDDKHNFVMEGRHRLVAFLLLGLKELTVARVSVKCSVQARRRPAP